MAQTASISTIDQDEGPDSSVASIVRAELARRKVKGRQLAAALGWSERTTRRRLAGELPFTVDELTEVARHLKMPTADLLPPTT